MTDWAYIICISKANNASSLNPNKNHLIHGLHEAHKEILINLLNLLNLPNHPQRGLVVYITRPQAVDGKIGKIF